MSGRPENVLPLPLIIPLQPLMHDPYVATRNLSKKPLIFKSICIIFPSIVVKKTWPLRKTTATCTRVSHGSVQNVKPIALSGIFLYQSVCTLFTVKKII